MTRRERTPLLLLWFFLGLLPLLVRPLWRFWRAYLFKLGFLDGWQGFTIAWMTAFYTFLRYARVREARMQKPVPQ